MKVPVKWLSEFVSLDRALPDLAHLLTMSGLEVESIASIGQLSAEFVTGRVVDQQPHPKGDRLTLVMVETASGDVRQVVCGARNMKPGDVVVVALPGAVLPDGKRIDRVELRGKLSEGMLCSARELSLGTDHEGLLILDADTPVGQPFSAVYPGADTVLDVSLTPNRADCLSILGIAREISALTGQPLKSGRTIVSSSGTGDVPARLDVMAPELCPTYYGRVLTGVQVGPSPSWLVARLAAAGLRSINNVVDATNYILLERGQPLHAFDLDRLAGQRIVVRSAIPGERILALDNVERSLDAQDLAICDEQGPVAIAGVMGGLHSAVSQGTRRLLLEAAWFAPESVRATARRTGLRTEASHRFERGVDPGGVLPALEAVTALILKIAGGEVQGPALAAIAPRALRGPIRTQPERVNALLGLRVPPERMRQHLEALQMQVLPVDNGFDVLAPSYRLDIEQEADLAEEVARMEGYEQLPTTRPLAVLQSPQPGATRKIVREIVAYLASRGLDQVLNYAFTSPQLLDALRFEAGDERSRPVRVVNPLTEELSVMRTALLPSLLKTAVHNERHQTPDLKIFEIGKVFLLPEVGERPREVLHLGCLLMGAREPRAWTSSPSLVDIYDLKGVLDGLIAYFRLTGVSLKEGEAEPFLAPGQGWTICSGDVSVGHMGSLHPEVGRSLGLEQAAFVFEVQVEQLLNGPKDARRFKQLPRFPSVARDLAVILDARVTADELVRIIEAAAGALLESVSIFDVYRGKNIPDGKKSIACNLVYRAGDRTLLETEVQELHEKVLEALGTRLGAQLRA